GIPMSIVVIDSNRQDLEKTGALLSQWGYNQSILCKSIEEARGILGLDEKTLRTIFGLELILIDISQGEDFAQLVDRIRSMLCYEDIPILAMAEGSRGEKMPLAFAFGATDFVSKPIEDYELRARVRSCLRLKHEIDRRKARERELIEATHQLSDLNQILTKMSLLDSLTTIPNRRCFDESLEQEWKRAFRNGGNIGLILCDIDFFKQFNDTYGHQRGDACLQRVAQHIKNSLKRPGDLVARYGGEEFAIILPHTTAQQAVNICNNIRASIRELGIDHAGSKVSPFVTISMGVASTEPSVSKMSVESLIAMADGALYQAKQQGRDQFQIAQEILEKSTG
ncbi:MAG: diguanylate cyclase, partial [Proteobacteria bacterium]|nr:diguanylate cyclase [Pseudomonadota bacterium]